MDPGKEADSRIVRVTSTAEPEQLKLEGSMVTLLSASGLGDGLGDMTNVKEPCASTLPLESRRRAVWAPGPIEQLEEPSGLVSATDHVPSACCVMPKSVTACVTMFVSSIWYVIWSVPLTEEGRRTVVVYGWLGQPMVAGLKTMLPG